MTVLGEADRAGDAALYVQEDWKATHALTLNLGWDYQQQPFEQNNGYSNFNPNLTNSTNGLKGAYQFANTNGLGRNFWQENYHDIGPAPASPMPSVRNSPWSSAEAAPSSTPSAQWRATSRLGSASPRAATQINPTPPH